METKQKLKYKVMKHVGSHYVVGMYIGFNLVMTFNAYPSGNPDYFTLYPKDYILYIPNLNKGKRRLHYSDIDFSGV